MGFFKELFRNRQKESAELFTAISDGDQGAVRRLIDDGVDVNCTSPLRNCFHGSTPAFAAAYKCNGARLGLLKVLIDAGASLHELSSNRENPLHVAARSSSVAAITALVDGGADLEARWSPKGWTALHAAAYVQDPYPHSGYCRSQSEQLDVIQGLVVHGARVNATTDAGGTPLDLILTKLYEGKSYYVAIVDFLLQHGARTAYWNRANGMYRSLLDEAKRRRAGTSETAKSWASVDDLLQGL